MKNHMDGDEGQLFANFVGSVLSHSLNRCISDFAIAPSKFLATLGTSDTPQPLCEITPHEFNTIFCRNTSERHHRWA